MQTESPVLTARKTLLPAHPILDKLEKTERKLRVYQWSRLLIGLALVEICLAGVVICADWLWVLGTTTHAGALLVMALTAVTLMVRGGLFPQRRYRREDVAVEVESGFPELGQRVRTTLEYVEPTPQTAPAAPILVEALATDTELRTRALDFRGMIPWRRVWGLLAGLAVLSFAAAAMLASNPELRIAALRLLLVPAQYTELEVSPGDHTLKLGSELTIQATVTGRPVQAVDLLYRASGSDEDWTALSMAPPGVDSTDAGAKLSGTLTTSLQDCRSDLDYRVTAGAVESPIYHLTVTRPLVLKKVEATIQPPAYARRPTQKATEGNFTVLEGSQVQLQFTLDRAPQSAWLLIGSSKDAKAAGSVPLQIDGAVSMGELIDLEQDVDYTIEAVAADGMRLGGPKFHIRVQPDGKPSIRFVRPQEQMEVTATTEVDMQIEAGDDLGLSRVGIVYQVGNGPKQTLYLKEDPSQPTSLKADSLLALEEHRVSFQDGVTYYAFAEDNYPRGPHRVTTELQFIDIRPYKRTFQLLQSEGGGC